VLSPRRRAARRPRLWRVRLPGWRPVSRHRPAQLVHHGPDSAPQHVDPARRRRVSRPAPGGTGPPVTSSAGGWRLRVTG